MFKNEKQFSEDKISEFKSAFTERDKDNDNFVEVSVLYNFNVGTC